MGKKSPFRGTFATFAGFIGDATDLLTGKTPVKERLRFYIDEMTGEAVLMAEDYRRLVEDPAVYNGGFEMERRLRLQMAGKRSKDRRRSSSLGIVGSGSALGYTSSAPDGGRQMAVSTRSIRSVVDSFRSGSGWSVDYVSNFGADVETEADRERDYEAIVRWLDQHGC